MEVDCVALDDSGDMSPKVSSTEVNKMKQGRLPFSPLEQRKPKKRKCSRDKNPKAAKIACKETKNLACADMHSDIEIIEDKEIGTVDSSKGDKEEKENISAELTDPNTEMTPTNSPICRKYEADSSSIDNPKKNKQESSKKRKKKILNNSPSIAALFKKITAREEGSVKVIELTDDEEPKRKKIKNNNEIDDQSRFDTVDKIKSIAEPVYKNEKKKSKPQPEKKITKHIKVKLHDVSKNSKIRKVDTKSKHKTQTVENDANNLDKNSKQKKLSDNNSSSHLMNPSKYSEKSISTDESKASGEKSFVEEEATSLVKSPTNQNISVKKKTPKQLEKERERKLKQEERDQIKAEKLQKSVEQKLQKEREKQSKKEEVQKIKDEKLKKKQEEVDTKTKEREEKRQKKEEDQLKKDLEKQKKEDEKQKKEEEKSKLEALKTLAEKEKIERKRKVTQNFARFFVPKKGETSLTETSQIEGDVVPGPFMKFTVKDNMKLAPLARCDFSQESKNYLDELMKDGKSDTNYLKELRNTSYIRGKDFRTLPVQEKIEECEIIEEDCIDDANNMVSGSEGTKHTVRAKLFLFCENRRPAYYGTWSKTSSKVTGRRPFTKENDFFEYDYDSDDDWEEEESGESLSDSEGEEEEGQGEEKYEEDNVFFVPHGYLSDDEGQDDELEDVSTEGEEKDGEIQKELLKKKQEEFEIEMKQKMKPLKPKVYGCVWLHDETSHQAYTQLVKIFTNYKAVNILGGEYPIATTNGGDNIPHDHKDLKVNDEDDESASTKKFSKSFPEAAVPDLIRLIHGNRHGKLFLAREFTEHVRKHNNPEEISLSPITPSRETIAKRKIEQKIQSIGQYVKAAEIGSSLRQRCWAVPKDIREKYGLGELSSENSWSYYFTSKEILPEPKEEELEEPNKSKSSVSLITKFTKVLTDQEKAEKMKQGSPLVEKGDTPSGIEVNIDVKTTSEVPGSSKNAKTPKSANPTKSAVKNIEKFFSRAPEVKTAPDCIELD